MSTVGQPEPDRFKVRQKNCSSGDKVSTRLNTNQRLQRVLSLFREAAQRRLRFPFSGPTFVLPSRVVNPWLCGNFSLTANDTTPPYRKNNACFSNLPSYTLEDIEGTQKRKESNKSDLST